MNRVLVLGSSGSGKSTFSQQLGERLGLEVIHLDSHFWQPNWTETPSDEWHRKLEELLQKDQWIMDGNYWRSLSMRAEYADAIIFLDYGRITCLWRCVKRWLQHRGNNRPELAPGCYEKLDWEFIRWIWNYPKDIKPQVLRLLADQASRKKVFRLKNDRDVAAFLEVTQRASV